MTTCGIVTVAHVLLGVTKLNTPKPRRLVGSLTVGPGSVLVSMLMPHLWPMLMPHLWLGLQCESSPDTGGEYTPLHYL